MVNVFRILKILLIIAASRYLQLADCQQVTSVENIIHDASIVEVLDLSIVQHNGHNAINGTIEYKTQLDSIDAHFNLDLERGGKTMYRLLSIDVDGCKFLDSSYNHMSLAKAILSNLRKTKSFPRKCPILAHKAFTLENFDVDWSKLPRYMPDLNFSTYSIFYTKGKKFSELIIRGTTSA